VFHALEKEVEARTPTVEDFLAELRAAVEAGVTTMQSARETIGGDFGATLFEPSPDTAPPQQLPDIPVGSTAGKISSAVLTTAEQEKLAASRAQHEFEQQERDRIAREELEREAAARRHAAQEAERKRKEEEERVTREKAEREERERQQREQIERVERQARELEERLAKLSTSMPPPTSAVDPESTQIHQGLRTAQISRSIPGVAPVAPHSAAGFDVSIPPKSKSKLPIVLGASLLVLLIVGSVVGYFVWQSKSVVITGGDPTPAVSPGGSTPVPETVETEFLIPGGEFRMGRNDGTPDELPEHPETVESFFMDRTEVTQGEYLEFVRDNPRQPIPKDWVNGKPLPGREQFPVINVSAIEAEEFAKWRSARRSFTYRLPTEAEWEYAARNGRQDKRFPWGDDWEANRAVIGEQTTRPVNSFPLGKNQWGVVDLIGNVWEWTSSKGQLYPGHPDEALIDPRTKNSRVVRGLSYLNIPNDRRLSATFRVFWAPTTRDPQVGFRLVRSAQ
jgi:formylglycine-generating enzyme required for sulfatase activity